MVRHHYTDFMIQRAIAAALLAVLTASAAGAAQFASPTYNEAADLAGGKSASAVYDGGSARDSVNREVQGALKVGDLSVPKISTEAASGRDLLRPAAVPAPDKAEKEGFFSGSSLKMGGGGAILGATVGWLVGGPIGALIGAAAGFGIGFLMSKILG